HPCPPVRTRVARRAARTRAERRSEETALSGPAPASPVRLRLHVPGTRLAPFPGQLVVRLQGERSIVRLEGIAEPLELLQGDALPRPRVRVAGLPLDRLFVPEETHLRIPALHRQLRELQEDMRVLFLRLDRLDERLEIGRDGGDRGIDLVLDRRERLREGWEIGDGLKWLGGRWRGPGHVRNRFAGRAHREMVGPEARRVGERRLRFAPSAESCMRSGRSSPRLDALRFEGGHLLEALEGLRGAIVIQEELALHEPRLRVIPSKGDGPIVVLDRRAPPAFALEELALSKEDGRV